MFSFKLQLTIRELSVPWIECIIVVESVRRLLDSHHPAFIVSCMISEQIHTVVKGEALAECSCWELDSFCF